MKLVTMNGLKFEIVSKTVADQLGLRQDELLSLGRGRYAYIGNRNREELYKAAGYNTAKIDFAVPQGWMNLPEIQSRYKRGDSAVWSYAARSYGGPVWDSEMLKRLRTRINQRLQRA